MDGEILKAIFRIGKAALDIDAPDTDSPMEIDCPDIDNLDIDTSLDIDDELSAISESENQYNVSFGYAGEMYDDNTLDFLEAMKDNDVEIPPSVDHYGRGVDRCSSGGLSSIDKSLLDDAIDKAYKKGKISKSVMEMLKRKLRSC